MPTDPNTSAALTQTRESAIRQRAEKATPGPWYLCTNRHPTTDGQRWGCVESVPHPAGGGGKTLLSKGPYYTGEQERADCDFIAHAREDVPLLLAEIDRLRAALTEADNAR